MLPVLRFPLGDLRGPGSTGAAMLMSLPMLMPHSSVSQLRSWDVIKPAPRRGGGEYGAVCELLNV